MVRTSSEAIGDAHDARIATFSTGMLIFDLDGTLVDTDRVIERSWLRWAELEQLDPVAVLPSVHGRPGDQVMVDLRPHFPPQLAAGDYAELRRQQSAETKFVRALPGAEELLACLPGHSWAVVASCDRDLALARLRGAGLPVPRVLITSDDVSVGKPDPECYLAAARALDMHPASCIVVEDASPGVAAARAAGMFVIGVGRRTASSDPRPHWHVDSLMRLSVVAVPDGLRGFVHEPVSDR
ncbi:HAD-IA family hydrolase [Umezawaea beigongshangensis]|uniref:HAD-IA family hydrolase n=1 Tax=Umezawaea beigongshangensis TaxID=2780383 RepID=UPI0018F209BF|nr:HAD-IA family hydrolase [Umezawaea beigongshangensis]